MNVSQAHFFATAGAISRTLFYLQCLLSCSLAAVAQPSTNESLTAGTLAYYLSTNTESYAVGRAGDYGDLLELKAPSSPGLDRLTNAVWSQSFWLKGVRGLGATPIGFREYAGGQGLPTMVSPRHFLCASHMHPEAFMLAFMDTNNVVYWRTTVQRVNVGSDTSVGLLNEDLPSSVSFLPVLPQNYTNYLPTTMGSHVQGIGMNQDMFLFSQPITFQFGSQVGWNYTKTVPLGVPKNWNIAIRGGDSSNPEMLLIGNQLILVSHNFYASGGPNYATQIAAINAAMHQLSKSNHTRTDYQLTEFSLTNWPAIH